MRPVKAGKSMRMSFSREKEVLEMPNLIEVQKNSYAWFINDGLTLMAETGPYFAFGLTGKDRITSNKGIMEPKVFGRIINGNRFDLGWGVQVSAMLAKNYQLHVAYDFGFINLNDNLIRKAYYKCQKSLFQKEKASARIMPIYFWHFCVTNTSRADMWSG